MGHVSAEDVAKGDAESYAYVSNEQNAQADLVLRANEMEVFHQALEFCSLKSKSEMVSVSLIDWFTHRSAYGVIVAIDVVHQVNHNHQRHDQGVNLAPNPLLHDQLLFSQMGEMGGILLSDSLATNNIMVV